MNCNNNQNNNNGCGCNCNPHPTPAPEPVDINMSVCDRNINMLPMLQTYTTKVLKPNIEGCCKKNILTQGMLSCENYKYVIKWDYDLNGQSITVPENCILEFDGGSLSNGTLVGDNTIIDAKLTRIFGTDITFSGTWLVPKVYPEWFGASVSEADNSLYINKAIDFAKNCGGKTVILSAMYPTTNTIYLKRSVYVKGEGGVEAALYSDADKSSCGIRFNDTTCSKWAIDTYDINGNTVTYNTPFHEASFVTPQTPDINADIVLRDFEVTSVASNESVLKYGAIRIGGCTPLMLDNIRIQGRFKYGLSLCQCYSININNCYFDVVNVPLIMNNCTTSTVINTWFCKYALGDNLDASMFPIGAIPSYVENPKNVAIMLLGSRMQAINSTFEWNEAVLYGVGYYAILDSAYYELGTGCKTIAFGTDAYLHQKGNIAPSIFLVKTYSHGIVVTKKFSEQTVFKIGFILEDISVGYVYIDDNSKDGNVSPIKIKCNPCEKNKHLSISYYDDVEYVEDAPVFKIKGKNKFDHLDDIFISTKEDNESFTKNNYWYTRTNRLGTLMYPTTYGEMCKREHINNCTVHYLHNYVNQEVFGGTDVIENKTLNITCDERPQSGTLTLYPSDTIVLKNSTLNFLCQINPNNVKLLSKASFKVSGVCNIYFRDAIYTIGNMYKFLELYGNDPIDVNIVIQARIYDDGTTQNVISNPDFTTPYIVREYSSTGELYKIYTNPTRPTTNVPVGYMYIENGKPIWYQGNNVWKDATGATV